MRTQAKALDGKVKLPAKEEVKKAEPAKKKGKMTEAEKKKIADKAKQKGI